MATPDLGNLSLFKGIVKFMPVDEIIYRDLGELSEFTTSMEVETVSYQSRRHASRIPVKTVNIGRSMTCAFTMSEMAPENLGIWLMAEQEGSPGFWSIGTKSEVRGAIRVVGTNEVGKAYQLDLYDVSLTPAGDLSWLTDTDWSEAQVTGSVNADRNSGSFGTLVEIVAGTEQTMGSPAI